MVDNSTTEMESHIKQLQRDISVMEDISTNAKKLKNKASYIVNQLDVFQETFLKNDEWTKT